MTTMYSNYTLSNGLRVHPVYVNWANEDGSVAQERWWATVTSQLDQSYLYQQIDVEVLQPIFRNCHCGKQIVNEMGRRKCR